MKPFFQCACLFLSLLAPRPSFETESKQLFEQIRIAEHEQKNNQTILRSLEDKIASYASTLQAIETQKERWKIDLLCLQNGIATDLAYEDLDQLYQESSKIQAHQTVLLAKQEWLVDEQERLHERLERLYDQKEALIQAHPERSGFWSTGVFEPEALIPGLADLPDLGGPLEQDSNGIACLEGFDPNTLNASSSFQSPFDAYTISAGTWAYPNGNTHLGMDLAVPLYSELKAPINGIILYANAPCSDNEGYFGNREGWPAGGGNTIGMIGNVEGQLYFLSFCHLSSVLYVRAGQSVQQGDVLALSGNSGNSTGPHCHLELFSLNKSLEDVLSYFMETADFSWQNGWNEPATCSDYACRLRPETKF